jgi:hypothetical protein
MADAPTNQVSQNGRALMKQSSWLILIAILTLPVLLALCIYGSDLVTCLLNGHMTVGDIDAGNAREFRILADCNWEVSCPLMYEVLENGDVLQPLDDFGFTTADVSTLRFRTLMANDGNLVAVVEPEAPDVLLIVHDFSTGDSWPAQGGDEGFEAVKKRGHLLLDDLQEGNPESQFILSSEVRTFENRKISR